VSNSYDPVTPKKRTVVKVFALVAAICAIFTASVGAAQGPGVTSVVSAQASLTVPATNDGELLQAQADPNGSSETMSEADVEPPSDELRDLVAEIEDRDAQIAERDAQIAALQEQLAYLRQEQLANLVSADEAARGASSFNNNTTLTAEQDVVAMEQWRAGYELGGGQNYTAFVNTILPCESGGQPNPDIAVGRTDDWGRSQINRPTWKKRFESLTGVEFEEHIVNPVLNGYMAAHVELEQGLNAWTCWRKR